MKKYRKFNHLPKPLNNEQFHILRQGIFDDEGTDVWVNDSFDFAFLDPMPKFDYESYVPRSQKFNLVGYKNNNIYTYTLICAYLYRIHICYIYIK